MLCHVRGKKWDKHTCIFECIYKCKPLHLRVYVSHVISSKWVVCHIISCENGTRIHAYSNACMDACLCIGVYLRILEGKDTAMYLCMRSCVYAYVCACLCVRMSLRQCTKVVYACVYLHIPVDMSTKCIHAHTQRYRQMRDRYREMTCRERQHRDTWLFCSGHTTCSITWIQSSQVCVAPIWTYA